MQHERVSDDTLMHLADAKHFGSLMQGMAIELIDRRKAAKYVQHLPGCKIWTYLKTPEYIGGPCTCGLDQIPEYIRSAEQ